MQKQPSRGALMKCAPKNTTKSTGEHPCRSDTPTKLSCSFIEVTLQGRRSPHKFKKKTPSTSALLKECTRVYSKIQKLISNNNVCKISKIT